MATMPLNTRVIYLEGQLVRISDQIKSLSWQDGEYLVERHEETYHSVDEMIAAGVLEKVDEAG